ncbi:MAG: putative transport system, permease component [Deltaproteobacteria bacterium]|nr:putative transport system, permease component [Deltaproteobacteria bacterium]
MAHRLLSIAANTFRETVRNKVLYVILAFALVVIALSWFLADLSLGDFTRIIADVGLACIHLFGVTIAVFLGISLVSQELDRKTIYLILSRPVPRWEFVLGKAAGLCATILLTTSVMAVTLFGVHASYGGTPEAGILLASAGICLELVLLVCIATLFSTFTTPTLSAMFTLALFAIGHLSEGLYRMAGQFKSAGAKAAATTLFHVLPNLEVFNWKDGVVHGDVRSAAILVSAAGYLAFYGAAVLLLACLLFERKDFK